MSCAVNNEAQQTVVLIVVVADVVDVASCCSLHDDGG